MVQVPAVGPRKVTLVEGIPFVRTCPSPVVQGTIAVPMQNAGTAESNRISSNLFMKSLYRDRVIDMKTLLMLAMTSLTFAQSTAKTDPKPIELPTADVISFLKAQRDMVPIQERYDNSFKNEPTVKEFTAKLQKLQQLCGKDTFNPTTVSCDPVKPPATPVPAPATQK
jgi:hypothetical protein